jgi:sugar/nucleoside kinase (ribokinase family)
VTTPPALRVLVVGDVIDDVVVRPRTAVTADSDTASTISHCAGGSAANQAAWMGELGVSVRFAGRVGRADVKRHTRALEQHGVDTRLSADPELPTGTIVVLLDDDGSRTMFTDRGANARLGVADLPASLLDNVGLLHVNGYALMEPSARDALAGLIQISRDRDIAISVDPCSVAFLRDIGAQRFTDLTRGAALCTPDLAEGRLLAGVADPVDVVATLLETYEIVLLKCGPAGVVGGRRGDAIVRFPSPVPASDVVDPTGAGDAFCAGALAAFVSTGASVAAVEVPDMADAGQRAAAQALAVAGGRPPIRPARLRTPERPD